MDVGDAGSAGEEDELIPRLPEMEDLVAVCRRLNEFGIIPLTQGAGKG